MRYLRLVTILIFIAACGILGWTLYSISLQDTTVPQITDAVGELHLQVSAEPAALLQGLTATDDRDGDLTHRILVERTSRFSEPGVCQVSYVVFDNSNNFCRYQRKVVYEDYVSPRLLLKQPLLYRLGDPISILERIGLEDALEGDITYTLKLDTSNVPYDTAGTFAIGLEAANSYGDTVSITLPLNVVTTPVNAPQIQLTQNLVYVKVGQTLSPLQYIEAVRDHTGAAIPTEQVTVTYEVDLTKPGGGQLCFTVTDAQGVTGVTYLAVIVEEA